MQRVAAPVLEVFASVQGEGLFVGQPQTFLRLAGCPLRCRYCDTPHSWAVPEEAAGAYLTPFEAIVEVKGVEHAADRPLSVTGGEPLAWPAFLAELGGVAGERPLHLETAGHDLAALRRVAPVFQHLSLDLKRSGDLAPPARKAWPDAELPATEADFDGLRAGQLGLLAERAAAGLRDCVKLVVVPGTPPAGFTPLLEDVRRLAPAVPLFLTPATPSSGGPTFEDLAALEGVLALALDLGLEPRVLPQMHRALGVR